MPRPQIENCCVHVTHRCHRRQFLLDTDVDRKQYVKRLWEAKTRFTRVRILNYCVTSNHVHLLVWGHHELAGTRKRYRIIDFSCLLSCLGLRDEAAFSDWYAGTLNNLCRLPVLPAEPFWGKAFAVGEKSWLQKLAGNDTDVDDLIAPADSGEAASEQSTWYLQATQGVLNRLKRHLSD